MAQGLLLAMVGALGCGLTLTRVIGAPSAGGGVVLRHRALTFATTLAATPPLEWLGRWAPWATCVEWAQEIAGERGILLGRYETTGLLAMGIGLCAVGCAVVAGNVLVAPVVVGGALIAAPVLAGEYRERRRDAVVEAMPDLLRSLASSLGAGMTLTQAIGYVGSHAKGDAGQAFRHASLEVACGSSVAEAIQGLTRTLDAPGVGMLSCALVVSQRTGASLDGLLNRSADLVEEQTELVASLGTKTAQARLSSKVVMVMPILIVLLMCTIMPDYRDGLTSPIGLLSLMVAGVLDVTAMMLMRSLMAKVQP